MIDINSFCSDTPGIKDHIHFNNAGASLPPKVVTDAVIQYTLEESMIGGYEAMLKYQQATANVYTAIGKMIHAAPSEIALLGSATAAWLGAFQALELKDNDTILCSEAEYASNYLGFLRRQKDVKFNIKIVPSTAQGEIDVTALEAMIDKRVALIAITHIPTNGGLVNPASKVGAIANKYKIPYLLDACQSIGQLPINVKEIGCDFLSATGRKYLRAPRGTGFLYVNHSILEKLNPHQIDNWGAQWTGLNSYNLQAGAKRFETFEKNYGLIMGLGKAVEYHLASDEQERYDYIKALAQNARDQIGQIPGCEVKDIGIEKCGIVTFSASSMTSQNLVKALHENGIATSLSAPHGALIDALKRNLGELVRASFHYYNTEAELARFIEVLRKLV